MSDKTSLQEVADAYAAADQDTMDVLENMDQDSLQDLDRTLQGIQNSIEILTE
jgi:hypothetical protein